MNSTMDHIQQLESTARDVLGLKRQSRPRRPIVIEFCGSPKSGKSSCIQSLNIFLKRNGFNVRVITERASVCPIDDKFDPYFNIWTSNSAITELTECLTSTDRLLPPDRQLDVILVDRGIFDALCWFTWQRENSFLEEEGYDALVGYLTMRRFTTAVDLVYVFQADPRVSIEREYATLLTKKRGSVMNEDVLTSFGEAMQRATSLFRDRFLCLESINTSQKKQNMVSLEVTQTTLATLKDLTMERIGWIDRGTLDSLAGLKSFSYADLEEQNPFLNFGYREEVESDPNKVQPIPVAVVTNTERTEVLVLRKREVAMSDTSPERNRLLIWAGGHTRREDNVRGATESLASVALTTLQREIKEELGVSLVPIGGPELCLWDTGHPHSAKHLALCFVCEANLKQLRIRPDRFEIQTKRTRGQSGKFFEVEKVAYAQDLEAWSIAILERIFGRSVYAHQELLF